MTKKNPSNNKRKQRSKPKASNQSNMIARPQLMLKQHIPTICGLSDPFCSHAFGAKFPDDSPVRTFPINRHYTTTLNTFAAGNGMVVVVPNYRYGSVCAATTIAGGAGTIWEPLVALSVVPNTNRVRLVSMGIIVRHIAAPLTASGTVYIRTLPDEQGTGLASIGVSTYFGRQTLDVSLQDCSEVAILPPHTSQMPQTFYRPDDITPTNLHTAWVAGGFAPVTIGILGGPASVPVLSIEIIEHWEITVFDDDILGSIATPPPPANALVTTSAARVTSSLGNLFLHGVEDVGKRAIQGAGQALSSAIMHRLGI